ncbi:MAG TPA: hypothetical protein DCM28_08785 [Phycisphaerales bacterium]|nr:hypothetical protein [Phycisphaerales bacterium]|tara:strand:+ start:461 stop:1273 length:813 start_codon:yes stop_codon:yes gene_type:complete
MPDNPATMEVRQLLRSYERATGLLSCFRGSSAVWHQPEPVHVGRMGLHLSPFCVPQRRDKMAACKHDDADHLHTMFGQASEPLVRTCHAGADEIIIPVHWQNQLVAVVFLGQFRRRDDQPAMLPLWSEAKLKHALVLAAGLQSQLLRIYQKRLAEQPSPDDPRLAQVTDWLNANLANDPSLDELAVMLCVSPTWASHLIRQLAGQSYTQLKDDLRLARAKDLLSGTTLKIAAIATHLGLEDANYFSRFFKRKAGMTATAYRKVYQLPQQV